MWLSNIKLYTDKKNIECAKLEYMGSTVDYIDLKFLNLTKAYYNVYDETSAFQLPLSGTFNNKFIKFYHDNKLKLTLKLRDECRPFYITYDLYEVTNNSDLFDTIQNQNINHWNWELRDKKEIKLYFNHHALGLCIVFDDDSHYDRLNQVTLKFIKTKGMPYTTLTITKEQLKEMNETYGKGVIPFSPKGLSNIDTLMHTINLSDYDIMLSFEFDDDTLSSHVDVGTITYNCMISTEKGTHFKFSQ